MSARIAPATSRRLAIALALAPVALLVVIGFNGYRHIERQGVESQQLSGRILQLQDELKVRQRVVAELELLERASEHEALLVQAPSPTLAGAKLQGLISQLVEESGGVVQTIQVLDPKAADPFIEIAIRVEAEVSMSGLRQLLHAIETGKPLFSVDKLAVAPLYANVGQQDDSVGFKADISAFTWGGQSDD